MYKFWCYPRKILGGGGAGNVFLCVCKYLLLGGVGGYVLWRFIYFIEIITWVFTERGEGWSIWMCVRAGDIEESETKRGKGGEKRRDAAM